ncbi:peroxiredoxin-like family protein [Novipirellula artificiosorum]|uniref:AhpC/TSA family protein n=1 Tax=Novipirellula artificiosorum TaxID=2528016 RepID=A0A5C6DLG4_9BACT|nr:peroxiredoxin-like family protein [Novipirellula artificiosorum]TWU37025.1 AhpC/TSA family protein [Novipirellula artificiosorum]
MRKTIPLPVPIAFDWTQPMFMLGGLYAAFRNWNAPDASDDFASLEEANHAASTQFGMTLSRLSGEQPVLLVFLRHLGCTFCRETLADLSTRREQVEKHATIVLVHMTPEDAASQKLFDKYSLGDVHRISDAESKLYRAYGLTRGQARQLLGPSVWWSGFKAAVLKRHAVGKLQGDGFQMPGVFLVHHDQIIKAFRHRSSADRPDYCDIAEIQSTNESDGCST